MKSLSMCLLLLSVGVQAQVSPPPSIPVLGVGRLEFEVATDPGPDAVKKIQGQTWRAYVAGGPPVPLTVTCIGTVRPAVLCSFPLSQIRVRLKQDVDTVVAIVAVASAADGEQETGGGTPPFVSLVLVPPAVGPATGTLRVTPAG